MKPTEIERLFNEDIRSKKKIGSNIYKRTGTRGYTGTIRSPHDLLKGKAKKQYEGNSKVMTTNMYDKILPRSEFDKLEKNVQRNMYSYWYLTHGIKRIQDGMGIGAQTVYDILDKLEIPRKGRPDRKPRTAKPKTIPKVKPIKAEQLEIVDVSSMYPSMIEKPKELDQSGFSIKFNGSYKADQIQKILNKLDLILQDETGDFNVTISINQN